MNCCRGSGPKCPSSTNQVQSRDAYAIRPVALGRKNHLFAGSDGGAERWATVCSLIASAKLNDVEPFAYLRDILQRMTEAHPMSRLDDLLPWNWPKMRVKH